MLLKIISLEAKNASKTESVVFWPRHFKRLCIHEESYNGTKDLKNHYPILST